MFSWRRTPASSLCPALPLGRDPVSLNRLFFRAEHFGPALRGPLFPRFGLTSGHCCLVIGKAPAGGQRLVARLPRARFSGNWDNSIKALIYLYSQNTQDNLQISQMSVPAAGIVGGSGERATQSELVGAEIRPAFWSEGGQESGLQPAEPLTRSSASRSTAPGKHPNPGPLSCPLSSSPQPPPEARAPLWPWSSRPIG